MIKLIVFGAIHREWNQSSYDRNLNLIEWRRIYINMIERYNLIEHDDLSCFMNIYELMRMAFKDFYEIYLFDKVHNRATFL